MQWCPRNSSQIPRVHKTPHTSAKQLPTKNFSTSYAIFIRRTPEFNDPRNHYISHPLIPHSRTARRSARWERENKSRKSSSCEYTRLFPPRAAVAANKWARERGGVGACANGSARITRPVHLVTLFFSLAGARASEDFSRQVCEFLIYYCGAFLWKGLLIFSRSGWGSIALSSAVQMITFKFICRVYLSLDCGKIEVSRPLVASTLNIHRIREPIRLFISCTLMSTIALSWTQLLLES